MLILASDDTALLEKTNQAVIRPPPETDPQRMKIRSAAEAGAAGARATRTGRACPRTAIGLKRSLAAHAARADQRL